MQQDVFVLKPFCCSISLHREKKERERESKIFRYMKNKKHTILFKFVCVGHKRENLIRDESVKIYRIESGTEEILFETFLTIFTAHFRRQSFFVSHDFFSLVPELIPWFWKRDKRRVLHRNQFILLTLRSRVPALVITSLFPLTFTLKMFMNENSHSPWDGFWLRASPDVIQG